MVAEMATLLEEQLEDLRLTSPAQVQAALAESGRYPKGQTLEALATELGSPFGAEDGPEAHASVLATELQVLRLEAQRHRSEPPSPEVTRLVQAAATLAGVPAPAEGATESLAACLSRVDEAVGARRSAPCSGEALGVSYLNGEQLELFERVNRALLADFQLRRKMLCARLDVTIQSFLWGDKARGHEPEIMAMIEPSRKILEDKVPMFTIADVMQAPQSLLRDMSKRVTAPTADGTRNRCTAKRVIIGQGGSFCLRWTYPTPHTSSLWWPSLTCRSLLLLAARRRRRSSNSSGSWWQG